MSVLPKITQNELASRMLCLKKVLGFYEEQTQHGTRPQNQLRQLKREQALSGDDHEKAVLTYVIKAKERQSVQIRKAQRGLTTQLRVLLTNHGDNLATIPGVGIILTAKLSHTAAEPEDLQTEINSCAMPALLRLKEVLENTAINLTIPKDILSYLKQNSDNMSKYISEALRERIAREKREKALREILAGKPTFTDVKDGTTYVRELRAIDKKRDKRLGLI